MIKELKLTRRRKLLGAVVICVVLITGSTMLWQIGQVAEAAILDPHPGLVGWWRFDEGAGTIAEDSSGYGNDGTIYGATWVDGKYSKALSFDGIDDKVDCGSALADPTVFTLAAWIKSAVGFSGHRNVIARGPGGSNGGWELKIVGESYVAVGASFSDQWRGVGKGGVIVAGEWQMVTAVWNRTYFYLYVNGDLVAQSADLSAYTRQSSTSKVWVGSWWGTSNFFDGIIDEARIYNRPLLATEIGNLFQKGPDFSSRLLAKVPKGTTQFVATLSWQGYGSINVTVESPSETYTEDSVPVYQKTTYASDSGDMLNIKRLAVSVTALSSDEDWYVVLEFDDVQDYRITVEIQK